MQRNPFEQIKQIIDDQTKTTPGQVSNLHGVIEETVRVAPEGANHMWYGLTVDTDRLLSIREYADLYSLQRNPVQDVTGTSGVSRFPVSGTFPPNLSNALFGAVNLGAPAVIPITVKAPGSEVALYVEDRLVQRSRGEIKTNLRLPAGVSHLAVIAYGSGRPVSVVLPQEFGVMKVEPMPAAPLLSGDPVVDYLKADNGSYVVTLSWLNDAYASAWQVYRCEAVPVGVIRSFAVTEPNVASIRVTGSLGDTPRGRLFLTKPQVVGEVEEAIEGTDGSGNPITDFLVALLPEASRLAADYVGYEYMRPTEQYQSLGRVSYNGDAVVTLADSATAQDKVYVYRVSAFGFIVGVAESDLSAPAPVWVQDRTPPGDIAATLPDDVQVVNGEIYLEYTAPADADYRGVKVFLEDPNDSNIQTLLVTETGYPSSPDALSFRPPRAGRYRFRTFDWAGNVQDTDAGVVYDYDGNGGYLNALSGILTVLPTEAGDAVNVSLAVSGPSPLFPATVRFFKDQLITPIDLDGTGLTALTLNASGSIAFEDYSGLTNIPLPITGSVQIYAEMTDVSGNVTYAYVTSDRGAVPGGTVVVEDYLAFPNLACLFDEDTEEILLTIPDGQGGTLGTVRYTRGNGLPASGGGVVIYTVGSTTVVKADTSVVAEAALPVEGKRETYKVEYLAGATTLTVWQGALHGLPANPPTLDPRVSLDQSLRNAVDVYVTLASRVQERVTLHLKDEDDPTLPVWLLVTAENSSTPLYVTSGTEVAPDAWFKRSDTATWAQKLDNIVLRDGQTKRLSLRAVGEDSLAESVWVLVSLPLKEVPVIESVDLVFDENIDKLFLSATGGVFCGSALFEISPTADFSTISLSSHQTLPTGTRQSVSLDIVEADRVKRWYGRVQPYNGPLQAGLVSGLGGIAVSDSTYVPSLLGNEPKGNVLVQADGNGDVTLFVSAVANTLSFGYTASDTAFDFAGTRTLVNFDGQTTVSVDLGALAVGQTKYVVVWFYAGVNGTGDVSDPTTGTTSYNEALSPRFDYVIQTRDPGAADQPRVDFRIRIRDPRNLGGTLWAWVNKESTSSADPLGLPDSTIPIASTPYEANFTNWSFLNDIKGSGAEDKIVYFEFTNSSGQTTGKKEVRLTNQLIDIGPDGKLADGVVDLTKLIPGLTAVQIVASLPEPAADGMIVFLTVDGKLYRRKNGLWTAEVPSTDITGQITTTQISDSGITTPKLAAFSITTAKIASGAITAGKIAANSVTAGTIAAAAVTADAIQAGAVTASKIAVSSLSEIVANAGIIVSGKLQSGDGQRYLDLNASGGNAFLFHPRLRLNADGTSVFSGKMQIKSTDAANAYLAFINDGGTEYATVKAANGSGLGLDFTFRFSVMGRDMLELGYDSLVVSPFAFFNYKTFFRGSGVAYELQDVGNTTTGRVFEALHEWRFLNWKNETGVWYWGLAHGSEQFGAATVGFGLKLCYSSPSLPRYVFGPDGTARADVAWTTFSPKPPKPPAEMSAADWLYWGAEDARKPVKPYEGIPTPDHPEVIRLAKMSQRSPDLVAMEEAERYEKDVAKIAIGTANFAALLWEAVQGARTFEEFRARLGL